MSNDTQIPATALSAADWNIARIVIAHDCNEGQIPKVAELISQLEAFQAATIARLREDNQRLDSMARRCYQVFLDMEDMVDGRQCSRRLTDEQQKQLGRDLAHNWKLAAAHRTATAHDGEREKN